MRKGKATNYVYPIITAVFIGIFEVVLFYFLDLKLLVLPIAVLFDVIFTLLFVSRTFTYMSAFSYLLTIEILDIGLVAATLNGMLTPFLQYDLAYELLVMCHFVVVFLCCTINYLSDRGSKNLGYNRYFVCSTVLLFIPLITVFVLRYVINGEVFPAEPAYSRFIPVVNYAAAVNEIISGKLTALSLFTYSMFYLGFFVPVGFYIHLLMGKRLFVLRLIVFLLLPACFECYQYFMHPAGFLAEDIVLAFFGQLIGSAVYYVFNRICENVHGEEFLKKRDRMSFYR